MLARRMLALLLSSLISAACATAAPTPPPASEPPPAPTSTTTERPTPPLELLVRGADAPRNIPDPCALLTLDEATAILGSAPTVAERSYVPDDDSWRCDLIPGADPTLVSVQIYVNAAYPGWTTDLVDEGSSALLDRPGLVGVEFLDGGVGVELGQHLIVLVHVTDDGPQAAAALEDAAAGMVARRVTPD